MQFNFWLTKNVKFCTKILGAYSDWPFGRGIFINEKSDEVGIFIVWVGEEDQMRIMAMKKGADVQAIWDLFYAGVEAVHKGLKAGKTKLFFLFFFLQNFEILIKIFLAE